MRLRFALGGMLLACSLLGACGRSLNEAPAPAAAPAQPSPAGSPGLETDLDALERELSENEQRLALYLREPGSESRQRTSNQAPPAAAPAPAAPAPAEEADESLDGEGAPAKPKADRKARPRDQASGAAAPTTASPEAEAQSGASNDCELACRAFASMRRSADRICALTSEGDPRCGRARTRVEEAAQRIARAQCACGAD